MSRLRVPDGEGTERELLYRLRPGLGAAADRLKDEVYDRTTLPIRIREAVRFRIALINDCLG